MELKETMLYARVPEAVASAVRLAALRAGTTVPKLLTQLLTDSFADELKQVRKFKK